MKKTKILIILVSVLLAGLATTRYVSATPSANFYEINSEVFDDWGISRTRAFGEDGFYQLSETTFRPVIAFESLGEEAGIAHRLGEQIAAQHPNQVQRAEAIFRFVRDRVQYTSDIDQAIVTGDGDEFRSEEFARNADEMAMAIDQNGIGYGDCEDSAVLLAVMYKGAGYRSAIALAPGHTAALMHLPDYNRATAVFELNGESGWVWAEATGSNNPLGWVPKEFINTSVAAYEIGEETVERQEPAIEPSVAIPETGGTSTSRPSPFFGVMGFLIIMSLLRRRRRARYR